MPSIAETASAATAVARDALRPDQSGWPRGSLPRNVAGALDGLARGRDDDAVAERLLDGLLEGSSERYEQHVAGGMRLIEGAHFTMGTPDGQARHFCGETPSHPVELSPFAISEVPVTNELYAAFDASRRDVPRADRKKPVVDVTWFEADLFAGWLGCRLPTEAEWEFACGGGGHQEWCCEIEVQLERHAWYSENAGGRSHPVATREPNSLGLFDMHGNVWEWCADVYDQSYYSRSPRKDPVATAAPAGIGGGSVAGRSCRGGSVHALAEMCRTCYRLHEPPGFWAGDLGFRLAVSASAEVHR